jgi:hypothetical protein
MKEQATSKSPIKGHLPIFAGPERKRLRSSIDVADTELRMAEDTSTPPVWAAGARELLKKADAEVAYGDLDIGWRYLHEVERLLLRGRSKASVEAYRTALRLEAKEKLIGWRRQTVETLLDSDKNETPSDSAVADDKPSPIMIERLAAAMQVRDDHSDNVYFRNRLLRRQMVVISTTLVTLLAAFLTFLAFIDISVLKLELTINCSRVFVAMVLGGMGACLSALIGFASASADIKIPAHLANVSITLTRPLIGAVSGLVALLVLSAQPSISLPVWLIACLAFGFSERLVIGALNKVSGPSSSSSR